MDLILSLKTTLPVTLNLQAQVASYMATNIQLVISLHYIRSCIEMDDNNRNTYNVASYQLLFQIYRTLLKKCMQGHKP